MKTVRRLLYRQILTSVLFVTLAFLALFLFLTWSTNCSVWVDRATGSRMPC